MLLIVTLVLTALTLSGAALLTLMKTEREATATRGLEALVKGVDRSAVVFMIGALECSRDEQEQMGGLYDNPSKFCAVPLLEPDEGADDASRFTIISPKFTDVKIEGVRYGLVDESTRLNLQAVLDWDAESPGAGRKALMTLPGMTATAADSILDWIDPDEKARQYGAEAKFYSEKKLPYSPRNAVPVFLEELLLARGVTRAQLYGSDENFTYNVDKIDDSSKNALFGSMTMGERQSGEASVPWKELVTVFSAEKDVDPNGEARVDLNESDLEFLYSDASSRIGDELAKFLILYRQYGPYQKQDEEERVPARRVNRRRSGYIASVAPDAEDAELVEASLDDAQLDFTLPSTTLLATPLDLVGARVVVGNLAFDSPISQSISKNTADAIFKLLDFCSTNNSTTIRGRVNINAAPRAVLAALPGLETADVQKIIDERPDPAQTPPNDYRHAAWLYTKEIVSLEQMKQLYNKTTARGDVYRGQIVGFLDDSNETSRADVVVDGTTEPPRQVFYKDLSTLGRGFSDVVLFGGDAVANNAANVGGTDADWREVSRQTDIVDIVNDSRQSGYSFNAQNAATSANADPFAAVELATGTSPGLSSAPTPNAAALNTGPLNPNNIVAPNADPLDSNVAAASATPLSPEVASATTATDEETNEESEEDAESAEEGSDKEESGGNERKERLMEALRSAREARQAIYERE